MPTVPTNASETPRPLVPPRKRWTREQCAPLEASGLFEQERLELVGGELISKVGKNRPQLNAPALMLEWLRDISGRRFVNMGARIDMGPDDNPREPDPIILKREYMSFRAGNPRPRDVSLVVEIADGTLEVFGAMTLHDTPGGSPAAKQKLWPYVAAPAAEFRPSQVLAK